MRRNHQFTRSSPRTRHILLSRCPPIINTLRAACWRDHRIDRKDAKSGPRLIVNTCWCNLSISRIRTMYRPCSIANSMACFSMAASSNTHPFVTGRGELDAKPGERVRIYFVNAGPNEFSSLHPIGDIWDNVYESGNPANNLKGVQTYVVGPGSAATFDVIVESAGAYPISHRFTDGCAARGHRGVAGRTGCQAGSIDANGALGIENATNGNRSGFGTITVTGPAGRLRPAGYGRVTNTLTPGSVCREMPMRYPVMRLCCMLLAVEGLVNLAAAEPSGERGAFPVRTRLFLSTPAH